jgi:preprotein translocase subunit SecE
MAENTNKKPSIWSRMGKFFRDCKSEFKKLVWPTKQQLLKNSALVLVSIVVVGLSLALVDFGLNKGVFALKDLIDYIRPVS